MRRNWVLATIAAPVAILAAAAIAYAGVGTSATDTSDLRAGIAGEPPAVNVFDDAPYGVDPVVTGPVTGEFREKQKALRCDDAQWPHVPLACYPDAPLRR